MTAHARLSPSNLRWPHCPGSIREEAQYPDIAGEAAIDGTGTHLLLEMCLNNDYTPNFYDGRVIGANHPEKPDGWLVGADRIERVQMCINYINRRREELAKEYPGAKVTVESESKSDPGAIYGRTDWYGTCDVTIAAHVGQQLVFLETVDYKDGRGWVSVEGNTQLTAYMGGKLIKEHRTDVHHPVPLDLPTRMTVVQPKTNPPIRYADQSAKQVYDACAVLNEAAKATDATDAPLVAGKHCQWCSHKPNCTAQSEESLEVLKMTTDVVTQGGQSLFELVENVINDVESMDSQRLAELADARAGIEAAFDRVEAELFSRLEQGQSVDGYALKPGRASRIWNEDEETIVKMLKNRKLKTADIYPPKLASVAQIEKNANLTPEQKEKIVKEYVTTVAGSLKLTKVQRRAVEMPFADMVENKTSEVAQSTTNDVPSFL